MLIIQTSKCSSVMLKTVTIVPVFAYSILVTHGHFDVRRASIEVTCPNTDVEMLDSRVTGLRFLVQDCLFGVFYAHPNLFIHLQQVKSQSSAWGCIQ
jgi:hypothetical protein